MTTAPLLSTTETARMLGITRATLANWRLQCRGPKWQTNPDTGRCAGYRRDDVEAWLDAGHTDPAAEWRRRLGYAS